MSILEHVSDSSNHVVGESLYRSISWADLLIKAVSIYNANLHHGAGPFNRDVRYRNTSEQDDDKLAGRFAPYNNDGMVIYDQSYRSTQVGSSNLHTQSWSGTSSQASAIVKNKRLVRHGIDKSQKLITKVLGSSLTCR